MISFLKRGIPFLLVTAILGSIVMFILMASGVGVNSGPTKIKRELVADSLPLGRYEEPLTLTVGQMVSENNYVAGESASDNVMYDLCKEIMNIDLVSLFSGTVGEAYNTQLNNYMLGGTVPDLFFCSQNQLRTLVNNNMVQDLTEAYERYASPELRLAMEYAYTGDVSLWNDGNPVLQKKDEVLQAATIDGKLYGLPFLGDLFNDCPLVWIRGDWLTKYARAQRIKYDKEKVAQGNYEELLPKSFNDYLKLVYWFTYGDPDGNEMDDTFGFSMGFTTQNLNSIANLFDAYPGYYYLNDEGKYEYGTTDEGMFDTMRLLSGLYSSGCIETASATNGNLLKSTLAMGRIGTFIGAYWSVMSYGLNDAYATDKSVDWVPWAIRGLSPEEDYTTYAAEAKNPDTGLYDTYRAYETEVIEPMVPYNVSNNSFYCIGKDCVNPEALIIMANHVVDRYFTRGEGEEVGEYTKRFKEIASSEKYAKVQVEMYMPFRMDAPNKNIRYAYDVQYVLDGGDPSILTVDEWNYYLFTKAFLEDPKGKGANYYAYYKIFYKYGAYVALTDYVDYDYEKDKNMLTVNFKFPDYYFVNTPLMDKYNGALQDFEEVELVNMLTGGVDRQKWDSFAERLRGKGVTAILQELNG